MSTEQLPDHIQRPQVRPLQPVPVQDKQGRQMIALRDPANLAQRTMVVPPQAMQIIQTFRGERSIEEIASVFGGEIDKFIDLAKGLDSVGLLWGPTFEKLEAEAREKLASDGAFPARATMNLGESEDDCRAKIDKYFQDTEDPEIEEQLVALVAPHLDYDRGWPNYASEYHGIRDTPPPDRVVILGTNHMGIGDGVVLTQFGIDTPLGRMPADETVVSKLVEKLDDAVIVDQLDHLSEHSIELQAPWLQYCWGNVPVVSVLMPDPLAPMIEDEGRTSREQFVKALREVLEDVGGRTFFVASVDLSHVGPQFGEPRPVDDQRKFDVERHDRDMMAKFLEGDAEEFLSAMKWNKNPTRWCSVGNMAAVLELAQPQTVELLDYRQACDEQGMVMVTSAAMALI